MRISTLEPESTGIPSRSSSSFNCYRFLSLRENKGSFSIFEMVFCLYVTLIHEIYSTVCIQRQGKRRKAWESVSGSYIDLNLDCREESVRGPFTRQRNILCIL
jgi:hypothetical protein